MIEDDLKVGESKVGIGLQESEQDYVLFWRWLPFWGVLLLVF